MPRKKTKTYYADFETTQPKDNKVEVYLWCMVSGEEEYKGFNIKTYIDFLSTMSKSIIYFHNLKFDFSYIQYYLIKNNIKYELLEKKGTIYSVKFFDVELRDSLNFMPMTLKEVGLNYCRVHQKTSIDYEVYAPHQATQEEIDYCFEDCRVLEEGLNAYLSTIYDVLDKAGCEKAKKKVFKKLTNSGIAFEAFKELSNYDILCPKTSQREYAMYSPAYKGGYVYSNPCGIQLNIQMIDCNSMYPYIYSTIDMPFGNAIICNSFEDCEKFKFYITKIYIKYDLKEGHIPIIGGGVGKYGGTLYKSSSNGEFEELVVCNIDLELIKRFYYTEIIFAWGRGFETRPYFFKEYCDVFLAVKNANKGIKRAVAKVMLNSPYGKTAMNGLTEIKSYYIDESDDIVKSQITGYEVNDDVFQYLPIAIQVTAGARQLLLTTAEKIGFENVLYMDTDSIKFKAKETGIVYDPNILGAWKDEGYCKLFKTIAPKKYVYYYYDEEEGKNLIKYTCAGFNKKVLTEEMQHGLEVTEEQAIELMTKFDTGLELSCLQSKKIEGGRALIPIKKEIK